MKTDKRTYTVTVIVRDSSTTGGLSDIVTVTINLVDTNDATGVSNSEPEVR